MNRLLSLILLLGTCSLLHAQPAWMLKENANWKFYQFGGLRFVNNLPEADTSSMRFIYNGVSTPLYSYSGASVSDPQGNLLFYTDAYNVWDKHDQLMPNGNNLLPSNTLDGTLILPVLDNPSQYYIFYMSGTIDFGGASTNAFQLRYTKVDMSLNNGLGDVVPGQKNILVAENLSGQIKAVPGNDCNIWLITHAVDSAQFQVYEVTDTGVNTTPVISNVGNGYAGFMGPLSFIGHLNISHDRSRIAYAQQGGDFVPILELLDFDPATAAVSNATVIDTLSFITYNVCFSPNDSKLYLAMNNANTSDWHVASSLFQYDLNAANITASRVLLSDSVSSVNVCMRIGPDGKIYIPSSYGNDTSSGYDGYEYGLGETPANVPYAPNYPFHAYLGCIQNPDVSGTGCNYDRHAVALSPWSGAAEALGGEFVKPVPGDSTYSRTDASLCGKGDTALALHPGSPAYYYVWDDGSTDSQRVVNASGTYWVRNGDYCHYRVDTFAVNVEQINPVIVVNGFILGTTVPYASYQWLLNGTPIPGATGSTYTVVQNGDYTVAVTSAGGCTDTSAVYEVTNYTGIGDDGLHGEHVRIYPNPVKDMLYIEAQEVPSVIISSLDGRVLIRASGMKKIPVRQLAAGVYFIRLENKDGGLIKTEKLVKE